MKQSIKEIFHVLKKDGGYDLVNCIGQKEHINLNEILLEFIDKQLVKIDGEDFLNIVVEFYFQHEHMGKHVDEGEVENIVVVDLG